MQDRYSAQAQSQGEFMQCNLYHTGANVSHISGSSEVIVGKIFGIVFAISFYVSITPISGRGIHFVKASQKGKSHVNTQGRNHSLPSEA
jgi:hypothetical protein